MAGGGLLLCGHPRRPPAREFELDQASQRRLGGLSAYARGARLPLLMGVLDGLVLVPMRVLTLNRCLMGVGLVPIVVTVRVLVGHRLVLMRMLVALGGVQHHPEGKEERGAERGQPEFGGHDGEPIAAPMKGASAKTEAVRAEPMRRCASRYSLKLKPQPVGARKQQHDGPPTLRQRLAERALGGDHGQRSELSELA